MRYALVAGVELLRPTSSEVHWRDHAREQNLQYHALMHARGHRVRGTLANTATEASTLGQ